MADDGDIMFMLGEIKQRCVGIENHLATLNSKVAKHETELSGIRLTAAKIGGMILVVTGVFGFAWSIVADFLKAKIGL